MSLVFIIQYNLLKYHTEITIVSPILMTVCGNVIVTVSE